LVFLAILSLATTAAVPATGPHNPHKQGVVASLDLVDVAELVKRCGGAEPLEETLDLVRKHVKGRGPAGAGEILAFEENRSFVYALVDLSPRSVATGNRRKDAPSWLRRVLLLKPSTLIVDDMIRSPTQQRAIRLTHRGPAEMKADGSRFRTTAANADILVEKVLPTGATLQQMIEPNLEDKPVEFSVEVAQKQPAHEARFLHVLHVGADGASAPPESAVVVRRNGHVELKLRAPERRLRLTLPTDDSAAGKVEIKAADSTVLVPDRPLPSGVMPHGPRGAQLMERWDAPYRRERMPGWDVGRPCTHLVKAVEDGTFKPGRAIVFGCGTGTNAIYLAKRGFEVTGVDVSPTALSIAKKKADEANVNVEWMLADVVALPRLEPYDLIFDRGCYHHVCQYDSPGFVETLRQLSHAGTQAMILAGSPADGNRGGPPRIPEETIRRDFSELFDFEWLRHITFDSRNPDARGPSAWSIHLRRKDD
jgi:SAM-dependent methyltransferase